MAISVTKKEKNFDKEPCISWYDPHHVAREVMMFALIYTDGQLKLNDIIKECINQKWIPLMIYRDIIKSVVHIPLFNCESVAKSFMKRNLPKSWSHGTIALCNNDLVSLSTKGWILQNFEFPNKIKDRTDIQIGFEIFELDESPDLITTKL